MPAVIQNHLLKRLSLISTWSTALAAEAGLSWLQRRIGAGERSSVLSAREPDTAVSERLLGQSLEEVLIQQSEGEHPGRVLVWRAVRSIVITGPTDRRS